MADFLIISDAYWDDPFWASRHYVPYFLAKNHRVIFVEKAPTWISPLAYDVHWRKFFPPRRDRRVEEKLTVYSPRPRIPFDRRYLSISWFNQLQLALELNKLIEKTGFQGCHVISFDHKASHLFQQIRAKGQRCYYVVDEVAEFNWPLASKQTVLKDEINTVVAADIVFATSEPLRQKCIAHNPNSFFLGHGVNLEAFDREFLPPEDLRVLQRPIAGFVGKIEKWVDLGLIRTVAEELSDFSFVLIGPSNVPLNDLDGVRNIHYLGPRSRQTVADYMRAFDVGIIPFRQSELVRSVNPLKLYEYLAAGLPVVSSPMPAVASYKHLGVAVEFTACGFAGRVRELILRDNPVERQKRIEFARGNSWAAKVDELVARLEGL